VVICLELGANLHIAQLMPLPLTVSKIQIGFTFLVPAHPSRPGKRAVKTCVCVYALDILEISSSDIREPVFCSVPSVSYPVVGEERLMLGTGGIISTLCSLQCFDTVG